MKLDGGDLPSSFQLRGIGKAVLLLAALRLAAPAAGADPPAPPDPLQEYSGALSDPVSYEVELALTVTPPYHCRRLQVWLPVPVSDVVQQIGPLSFETFPQETQPELATEPKFGNRFAYFEFRDPQGAQIIRWRFQATVRNMVWNVVPEQVAAVAEWPAGFEAYLRQPQLRRQQELEQVLRDVVPQTTGTAADLASAMHWIDSHMTYDHVRASLTADADHALEHRRGHCSDYHGLCATLGRALGYPTRVTYGLALFPKNSPSHCKLEAFLPPHGWVSFDLSETQKLVAKIRAAEQYSPLEKERLEAAARRRTLAGFRENSWLLLTRGVGYELAPKASAPVSVVRTAYIEADGKPLPEPDPANPEQTEFSWMTAHRYRSDQPVVRPFQEISSLITRDDASGR